MPMSNAEYWKKVAETEKALERDHPDGVVWLVLSGYRQMQGGQNPRYIDSATPRVAAECIANGTHEEAPPERVAEHKRFLETEARRIEATRIASEAQHVITHQPGEVEAARGKRGAAV